MHNFKNVKRRLISVLMAISLLLTLLPVQGFADGSTVVRDVNQLKAALESPIITQIRLADNIYLDKQSITINPNKAYLVIDGGGYTVCQYDSNLSSHTINLSQNKNLRDITVKNMTIKGKNKNGFINIPDLSCYCYTTLRYVDVIYYGPQIAQARYSDVELTNCKIYYYPGYCMSTGNIVEAQNIRLAGNIYIVKQMPCDDEDLFVVTKKGNLTVAAGAYVFIRNNTDNLKATKSGFVKFTTTKSNLIFENNCTFYYYGSKVFQYGCSLDSVYFGKNCIVNVTIYEDLTCVHGLLTVNNCMTVDEGATVWLCAVNNTTAYPTVKFETKSTLNVNNPKDLLIYNGSVKKCNYGLAIGNCCDLYVSYGNIKSLEHWIGNRALPLSLGPPTFSFANPDGKYNAFLMYYDSKVKYAATTGYAGLTPLNACTAFLCDVNVIRIKGGSGLPVY